LIDSSIFPGVSAADKTGKILAINQSKAMVVMTKSDTLNSPGALRGESSD
jgi:hypothetical protein